MKSTLLKSIKLNTDVESKKRIQSVIQKISEMNIGSQIQSSNSIGG